MSQPSTDTSLNMLFSAYALCVYLRCVHNLPYIIYSECAGILWLPFVVGSDARLLMESSRCIPIIISLKKCGVSRNRAHTAECVCVQAAPILCENARILPNLIEMNENHLNKTAVSRALTHPHHLAFGWFCWVVAWFERAHTIVSCFRSRGIYFICLCHIFSTSSSFSSSFV